MGFSGIKNNKVRVHMRSHFITFRTMDTRFETFPIEGGVFPVMKALLRALAKKEGGIIMGKGRS